MPELSIIAETGHVFEQDFRILQDGRDWRHLQPSVILKILKSCSKMPASIISGQAPRGVLKSTAKDAKDAKKRTGRKSFIS